MLWRAWWLLALAVGVPVVLVLLHATVTMPGGWSALLSGAAQWDSAPVLLNIAAVIGWLLWAWALYEVGTSAVVRMRQLRQSRRFVPPPAQGRVTTMAGAAVLLFDALTRTSTGAASIAVPAAVVAVDTDLPGQSTGDTSAGL